MDDVGTRLRAARDQLKLTVDDVALRTRIPAAVLKQIDDNAFDSLPASVFTKGHLRAYAAAVRLDPEEIVREYLAQWPAATHELSIFRPPAREAHNGHRILTVIAGLAAMVFAYSSLREPGERTGTVDAPQPAALAAVPVATGDVAGNSLPTAAAVDGAIRLDMEPTAECWVSAVADGTLVLHRLLLKGERATVGAARELVVRIGDPAAFAYRLNGMPGRSLGSAGEPVTVTISEQNYRTFLDEETEPEPALSAATAV